MQGKQPQYKKPQKSHNFRSQLNAGYMESELGEKVFSKQENPKKQKKSKITEDPTPDRTREDVVPDYVYDATSTSTNFNIKKFNVNDVPRNAVILVVASRRSGKSTIIQHFLEQYTKKNKTDGIFLFTQTNSGFEGIPSVYRYKTLEPLDELTLTQLKVKKYNMKAKKKDKVKSNIIVILDDFVGAGGMGAAMRTNPILNKISVQGRHLSSDCGSSNMMVIMISQVFVGISPQIRLNTDFLFTTKIMSRNEREKLVNSFLSLNSGRKGLRESYEVFDSIVNKEDFNFIAIHTTKQNKKKFSDYVFSFKAPETLENRKLTGTEEDWGAHRNEVYW